MKVVFCLRNYLPVHIAGTEIYADALCKSLERMGVETVIVKPGFDKTVVEEYTYNNQRIIEYPQSPVYDKNIIIGTKLPSGLPFFEQILIKEQPHIIHFHELSGSNGITAGHLNVAKKLGIPIFTTLHLTGYVCKTGTLLYKNMLACDGVIRRYKCAVCCLHERGLHFGLAEIAAGAGILVQQRKKEKSARSIRIPALLSYPDYINNHRKLLEKIFTDSRKVFVLSRWFRQVLLQNAMPEEKIILLEKALPHFVKPVAAPTKPLDRSGPVRLVYLGRISEIKGLHLLLQAMNKVASKNWLLDIYGQTEEEHYANTCKELAKKNSDRIFFKQVLLPGEVLEVLQQYDALVFPSVIEEMVGLVVMEAFAAGIPVIGSDSKGIAEQVTDGVNGFLFKSGSSASLVTLLKKVLDDPAMLHKLGQNIQMPPDFTVVAKQVYDAYMRYL